MSVYLAADDILNTRAWGPVPNTLELSPVVTRANIRGGPDYAEVEAYGPAGALEETLGWLRRPVFVRNDNGMDVWWGFVNEVRLAVGAAQYTITLDALANRIAVAYADYAPDGSSQRETTPWAEDTSSIARYGIKEYLDSAGTMPEAQALARRAQLLADMASPSAVPSLSSNGEARATLICVGYIETLLWRLYSRLEGRIEFDGDSGRVQAIGWGISASNQVGFGGGSIQDMAGRLAALVVGNRIVVTGSASNNGTIFVTGATSETLQSVLSTAIYFQGSDDILASASILGFIKDSYWIKVAGSPANSRYHKVGATGDTHVRTSASVSGAIVGESAGPPITIEQGQKVIVMGGGSTWEAPGTASVTMALTGHRLAQSFVVPTTIQLAQVAVKVGQIGMPSDLFQVQIYSDSGGNPSTLVATGTLAASTMDNEPGWRWIVMPATILNAGTYWIVCSRQGTVRGDTYYTLQLTTTIYGTCKAWDGSAWMINPLGEYLPFKVWAGEDTSAQMKRIVTDVGQFFAAADVPTATGIVTNQYNDEDGQALDALLKLVDCGTAAGAKLHAWVSADRALSVYSEPDVTDNPAVYGSDGIVRQASGGMLPQGYLPVGQWVQVEGLSPAARAAIRVSPVMIEEAEYDWREQALHINRLRRAVEGGR